MLQIATLKETSLYVNSASVQRKTQNISFPNTGNSSFLRIQSEKVDDKFDSKFMD